MVFKMCLDLPITPGFKERTLDSSRFSMDGPGRSNEGEEGVREVHRRGLSDGLRVEVLLNCLDSMTLMKNTHREPCSSETPSLWLGFLP